jgi:hypothetical protein
MRRPQSEAAKGKYMQIGNSAPVGMFGPELLAAIKRASRQAFEVLEGNPIWSTPVERMAVQVALEKSILDAVQAGERDEARLCKCGLAVVLEARREAHPPPFRGVSHAAPFLRRWL